MLGKKLGKAFVWFKPNFKHLMYNQKAMVKVLLKKLTKKRYANYLNSGLGYNFAQILKIVKKPNIKQALKMPYCHKIVIFLLSAFLFVHTSYAQDFASRDEAVASEAYIQGEKLWMGNCASCHKVNTDLIGPALAGVEDRYDKEWIYSWVKNNQALVKSGDAQAVKAAAFDVSVMTAFPMLKNEQIDAILDYVNIETAFPAPKDDVVDGEDAAGVAGGSGWTPTKIFLAIVTILLLCICLVLSRLVFSIKKMLAEKNGDPLPEAASFGEIFNSRAFRIAATLLLFGTLSYVTYDNASSIGYQQGYAPEQPIKFSHKLHAGKWGIECQYCHSGASKGKSAVIPSVNVCMNCHKGIKSGPEHGTKEIGKIYDAIGWDVDKQQYKEGYNQEPVEWVRIHNLPDHVYFNHAQHVNAGQVECQTCHGEIQEMDVVEQHSTLGMGWCIDCHRDTEVQFSNNDYYLKHYEKLHQALKNGDKTKITVEDIGGLECQKCHY